MLPCTHSRRWCAVVAFLLVAVIFVLLWREPGPVNLNTITNLSPSDLVPSKLFRSGRNSLTGVDNATLGFEALFAVSPYETWRSEGLALAAQRTNLTVDIPPQVIPGQDEVDEFMKRNTAGSLNEGSARAWLGHLQVLEAARNRSSTLIFEDDVDWDLAVHDQARLVSPAIRNLSESILPAKEWPWGENWDVLWLGHCGERLPYPIEIEDDGSNEDDDDEGMFLFAAMSVPRRRKRPNRPHNPFTDDYILVDDPTLPPRVSSYDIRMSGETHHTRWVQHAAGPVCTFAYAVTGASVAKILSMEHGYEQAFDLWLHTRCRNHDLRCFSVNPEMFRHHYGAGLPLSLVNAGKIGDSDFNFTGNILHSARCNWDKGDDELVVCMNAYRNGLVDGDDE